MITVVTLSPAIDVTYQVDLLQVGESQRVRNKFKRAGGKGLNVCSVLTEGGIPNLLVAPLGGESGDWILRQLQAQGQKVSPVRIQNETRTCVAVVDKQATVINEPAAEISNQEFEQLISAITEITEKELCVISGSMPAELSQEQIARLFQACREHFDKLVIDTSGPNLLLAAQSGADLVKPNKEELLSATGLSEVESGAASLLANGAQAVLVSLGSEGAALFDSNGQLRATVSPMQGNATGAGDAMVAIGCEALAKGFTSETLLARAAAAGSLAVQESVAGKINWSQLEQASKRVQIARVK